MIKFDNFPKMSLNICFLELSEEVKRDSKSTWISHSKRLAIIEFLHVKLMYKPISVGRPDDVKYTTLSPHPMTHVLPEDKLNLEELPPLKLYQFPLNSESVLCNGTVWSGIRCSHKYQFLTSGLKYWYFWSPAVTSNHTVFTHIIRTP